LKTIQNTLDHIASMLNTQTVTSVNPAEGRSSNPFLTS